MSQEKATVTVRRPDGSIETIATKFDHITDALFSDIRRATRRAGRGDVVSYTNPEPAEIAITLACEGCKREVSRDDYHQIEREHGMDVQAYYCDSCAALFDAMGELKERRTSEISEPMTKSDA